jgi:hypothetical protein
VSETHVVVSQRCKQSGVRDARGGVRDEAVVPETHAAVSKHLFPSNPRYLVFFEKRRNTPGMERWHSGTRGDGKALVDMEIEIA